MTIALKKSPNMIASIAAMTKLVLSRIIHSTRLLNHPARSIRFPLTMPTGVTYRDYDE